MSNLLLPEGAVPTNLHLNPNTDKARLVTSDMYHICERIREIDPNLYILELERESREGSKFGFAIMEKCSDGVHRLIMRASQRGLDERILGKLRYIMAKDLHHRIALLDTEREKWEKEQHENELESLYERIGGPMHRQLVNDGFTQAPFPTSYRPMNRAARRHGRRMR